MNHTKDALNKEVEYEVVDVRVSRDEALLVLQGNDDAFGISIPLEQLETMDEKALQNFLEAKAKQRLKLLEEIERQKKADESKQKELEKLKGRKIRVSQISHE